jgi:enoyl-[acyl-carrier protein] reductase II
MFHTVICDMLGIRYPLFQGAMQGGGGPELVAAMSNAGGLGILPTFGGTEETLRQEILETRRMTDQPIAVNITPMGKAFTESRARIAIEMGIPIVTTGRADPGEGAVQVMKNAGVIVIPVVPSVEHALRVENEGADAIIASGCEAGGHVGAVSTLPLVPQVVDAVSVPVLAAGGIGDARGFLAALSLGAVGAQLGTRLMATYESNATEWCKHRLVDMDVTDTIVTTSLTGAPVRCIATPEVTAFEEARTRGADAAELRALAKDVRRRAAEHEPNGGPQAAAGEIAGMITSIKSVEDVVQEIMQGAEGLAKRITRLAEE